MKKGATDFFQLLPSWVDVSMLFFELPTESIASLYGALTSANVSYR
jgi:hypothetical protein